MEITQSVHLNGFDSLSDTLLVDPNAKTHSLRPHPHPLFSNFSRLQRCLLIAILGVTTILFYWFLSGNESSFLSTSSSSLTILSTHLLQDPDISNNTDNPIVPSSDCVIDSGGSCHFTRCYASRGPTECISGRCVCKPGYCAHDGICIGCGSLNITLTDLPQQISKAGNYSAIATLFFAGRPVWKQIGGSNWIWYCGKDHCWIVSDLAPNDQFCKAGLVGPVNEASTDPIYTSDGLWKYWNHREWLEDDSTSHHIQLYCHDIVNNSPNDDDQNHNTVMIGPLGNQSSSAIPLSHL